MKPLPYLLTGGLLILMFSAISCTSQQESLSDFDARVDHSLHYAQTQLKKAVETLDDGQSFPRSLEPDGSWDSRDRNDWTSGFFPGCLWYMYEYSGESFFNDAAVRWTESLEPVKNSTGTHDVGFMIFSSYGNGYRLTGDESYREVILQAAVSLMSRYKRITGVIRSWDFNEDIWDYPVIIDNMMNLELLFWASKNGGASEQGLIAEEHALNTMKNHIREDGGTYHVVDYNPDTGEVNDKYTHQGYAKESTWARGQAWGLYGFTMSYRELKNPLFLEAAQNTADYFIGNLPDDYVPYWDFNDPDIPNVPRDSSAAAIAASGLLELSTFAADRQERERYYQTALNILDSLCSPEYLTEGTGTDGILRHATGHLPGGSEIDTSLIYGDYFFIEALLRYKHGL